MAKVLNKIQLTIIIVLLSIGIFGCSNNGRLRDMYVANNLNNYGQGVYNSNYFQSTKDTLYVVAFVDTYLKGEKIKVEMKRSDESKTSITTETSTYDGKVTYAIPLKGPFLKGKYQVTVTYDKTVISTNIDINDQTIWPPLTEFVFNQSVINGPLKYSIFSDKPDTVFNKSISSPQNMSIEVPTTSSNWWRAKWLYNSPKATDKYAYGYNEIKEQNIYTQNIENNKGILNISESFNGDLWPKGTYRLELYQDIYNKPALAVTVELKEPNNASTSKAPTAPTPEQSKTPSDKPTEQTKTTETNQSSNKEHTVKENKVFMTSGIGQNGKNIDVILEYPYGLKTPLYVVAVTDYPAGTTLTYGLKMVNGNMLIGSTAEVVKDVTVDGMHYTLAAFKLYNKDTDNWPLGQYIVELYQNQQLVASSNFKIVAP